MKRDVLFVSMAFVLLNSVPQAALSQVPPVLPTDVTGPTAGGGAMLRDFALPGAYGSSSVQPSWFDRHFGRRHTYARINTFPAVLPYGQQFSEPVLTVPGENYIDPRQIPGY